MNDWVFKLKTLTPIWTGGVDGKPDKLHITGIRGSIRWWYEALIRGLGRYVCDPSSDDSCKLDLKGLNNQLPATNQIKTIICPACYLFGCTGWSGKFILRITEPDKMTNLASLNSRDIPFDLHFIEKKAFEEAEKNLLKMTLKLIIDYGAIGGKTVFKPSEIESKNNKLHHRDFGIIDRGDNSTIPTEQIYKDNIKAEIDNYLKAFKKDSFENNNLWPNLNYFWFIKDKYINRLQHNKLISRNQFGIYVKPSQTDIFLGGFIKREKSHFDQLTQEQYKKTNSASKKIFSFRGTNLKTDIIRRSFGYIPSNQNMDDFKTKIADVLSIKSEEITTGEDLIRDKGNINGDL